MARRRFFVDEIRNATAEVTGVDAEHLVRVLRVEVGQVFEISDNQRIYLARIEVARKSSVLFRVIEELTLASRAVSLSLYPALIKFDRLEWLLEKATELGASVIQPFAAVRTERGLVEASRKRVERWRKIGLEASQQSRRDHLPRIEPALRSFESIETSAEVRLLLDEEATASPLLLQLPNTRRPTDEVAILLGPEGGWTEDEREHIASKGWLRCSLGRTVLRSETAAIAALAVVQAAWFAASAHPGTTKENTTNEQ